MTKTELIAVTALKSEVSKKDTEAVVNTLIDVISTELMQGGKVQIPGFGNFEVTKRAARDARNPQTGEIMRIPQSRSAKFKAGKNLKTLLNE